MAIAGKNGKLTIDGEKPVKIVGIKNWSLDLSADSHDTTTLGDSWKTYIMGLKEWSASSDGDYNVHTDYDGQQALQDAFLEGTEINLAMFVNDENAYRGRAVITSLSIEDPVDDVVSISMEFSGCGELTFN